MTHLFWGLLGSFGSNVGVAHLVWLGVWRCDWRGRSEVNRDTKMREVVCVCTDERNKQGGKRARWKLSSLFPACFNRCDNDVVVTRYDWPSLQWHVMELLVADLWRFC
jgi:hypothetical protein